MAKGKYQEWITADGLLRIEGWARDGLTDEQIAEKMGVSIRTLYGWQEKYLQILQALKRGKAPVDTEVENALLQSARGYDYDEVVFERQWDNAAREYRMVETRRVRKHVQGNPTAQIFWLKNRKRNVWRDHYDFRDEITDTRSDGGVRILTDPHSMMIQPFFPLIDDRQHIHKILTSGRAATKSSGAAIAAVYKIVTDPDCSGIVIRKRHNKLRKTVYKEILRAIKRLGLDKDRDFIVRVSPMEITYKANGNKIYFTGSDSIDDTKGIIDEAKPIKFVLLDELTEFFDSGDGEDELQNIEATFIRGNQTDFSMWYLYNPPKNPNAPIVTWCRQMEKRKDTLHIHADYRAVPPSWLGSRLLESAQMLQEIDERQYRWVWLGESIGIDELIYYMFGDRCIYKPDPKQNFQIGIIGGDYGQQNATTFQAFVLDTYNETMRGCSEFYHSGRDSGKQMTPGDYADAFMSLVKDMNETLSCSVFYLYLDPSAKGLQEEIRRRVKKAGLPYKVLIRDAENDVALGISRVQKALTYGILTVSPAQENAIREFGLYEYDKKSIERGREQPVKDNDHCMDAIRYACCGAWGRYLKRWLPEDDLPDGDNLNGREDDDDDNL